MDIKELQEIVKQANLRKIKKALRSEGFADCKRDKLLRSASLYEIAVAPHEETPCFPDGKGNEFNGTVCRGVKGHEELEFVVIQQLSPFKRGCEDLSTKKMEIYAKKLPDKL